MTVLQAAAATRDGDRLLLQNDIDTNDAHVVVLQVNACKITLTYPDLHRRRLEFFQTLLAPFGAKWSRLESRTSTELTRVRFTSWPPPSLIVRTSSLDASLEGIASRIVFLIDWNHARKRLQAVVG